MTSVAPWEDEPEAPAIPSVREELDRKAVAELERVMHALDTRKLCVKEAAASLQTLWEITSGLVPSETMDLIAQSTTAVGKGAKLEPDRREVFLGPNTTLILERWGARCRMYAHEHGVVNAVRKDFIDPVGEIHPEKWAAEKFNSLAQQLIQQGLKKIT